MSDRDEAALRGPVSRCATAYDYIFPDHHVVSELTDIFSPDGRLLEQRCYNSTGSESFVVYRYDGQGRIVEKEGSTTAPPSSNLTTYRYDPAGRLDSILLRSDSQPERVSESVRYVEDGTKTHTFYPEPLEEGRRLGSGFDADQMLHFSLDAVAIMTFFDSNGRGVRKVLYDVDDRVIRRVLLRYDARGLLIEEGESIGGKIRDDFRNVYRYDEVGRQIEADFKWGDLGGQRKVRRYNEHGDIVEERVEQSDLLFEHLSIPSWTNQFSYHYDAAGNWIERTTETIPTTGVRCVSMICRREILYDS